MSLRVRVSGSASSASGSASSASGSATPTPSGSRRALCAAVTVVAASIFAGTAASGQITADVSGRVVDEASRPVAGARLELRPGSRRIISDEEGNFDFRNVAVGRYTVTAQRIGYQPLSVQVDVAASGASATIVLVAIPRLLDSVRVRERAAPNRFSGVVLDDAGLPVPDASVTVEGVSNTLRTDAQGRFVVPKEVHGTVVIRMRKIGYRAYLGSLRMIATRDDTLRMARLAQNLSAVQVTEASGFGRDTFVYKDLDQRMRWRNHQSGVVSREELNAMGRMNLCNALLFTPTGARYGASCRVSCVILNGEGKTLMPAGAFYADDVEMVEYYPPGSDISGNLAARGCGRGTPAFVIWLRKDATLKPS
jgi:protocatechuate 3,4-dioxygenase beta subunit